MRIDFVTFIRILVAAICVAMLVWMCSCNTPKPMVTTTSNTEVKHDSTTNTTTEITTNETIKESDVAQSVDAGTLSEGCEYYSSETLAYAVKDGSGESALVLQVG